MAMTRTSTEETGSSKVYSNPVHSTSAADDNPIMDSSSNPKTILLPRQDKPPSKVISPQSQQQLQNDVRPNAFLNTKSCTSSPVEHVTVKRHASEVGKALQKQIRNSPKKVLPPKQKVLQPIPDDSACVKDLKNALVTSDASSNGLDDQLEEQNIRVFDGGDSSIPVEELVMSTIDVEMVEDSRVDVNKDKGVAHPVSNTVPGKVVYGNMEAMSDLLSKHMNEELEEETGIFLSRTYWFLHSDERQEVLRKKVLGRGSYGVVELYHHRQTEFVKKQVNEKFQVNEVLITATLDNPYIIRTFGLTYRLKKKTIFMENWGKSLLTYSRMRRFPEVELWDLMFQGVSGLEYLDQFGIRHHDMKPENILLKESDGKFLLKIADFGAAKWSTESNDMEGWTPEYLSPERAWFLLLRRYPQLRATGNEEATITGKSDIYSFALTMCFPYERCHMMLKHLTEGKHITEHQLMEAKLKMLIEVVANPELALTMIPSSVGPEMKQLLTRMLAGPVEERVTAGEARRFMYQLSEEAEARRQEEVEARHQEEADQIPASDDIQSVPMKTIQQTAVVVPSTTIQSPSMAVVHPVAVESLQPTTSTTPQPVVTVVQPQQLLTEALPSSSAFHQPEHVAVLSPALPVDSLLPVKTSSTLTLDVVQTPLTQQEHQIGVQGFNQSGQESAVQLGHLTTQIQSFDLQHETISLSKSLNPEENAVFVTYILPNTSKVVIPRLSAQPHQVIAIHRPSVEPSVVDVTKPTTSTLSSGDHDWKKMVNTIKLDNMDDYSDGLKSRMIKRKLQNKLPNAKKQRLQEEPKIPTRKRRGRKSVESQDIVLQNIPVESEQNAATDENKEKCGGNLPDLDVLF